MLDTLHLRGANVSYISVKLGGEEHPSKLGSYLI